MITNRSRNVRFLFRTEAGDRQFCWFEQRGNDLYWGPSHGTVIKGAVATVNERGMTLTVLDEIEKMDDGPVTASFHASGQFHLKRAGKLTDAPLQWRLKDEIKAPYRIAALLSKHPILYEPYPSHKPLTRGRTSAQVIQVTQEHEVTRHYFEFFVSPEGRFSLPPSLLALTSRSWPPIAEAKPMCFSLSKRLILVT